MIRRTRSIIFLAIIIGFSFILSISVLYEGDTYRAFSFNMQITEIHVVKNETSGRFHRVEVSVNIDNPSLNTRLRFIHADTRIWLNNTPLRYGWGVKGSSFYLQPGENRTFSFYYPTPEDDWELLQWAEDTNTWNWLLYQEPFVNAGFLGSIEVIRINTFEGVQIIPP
ncbi:MAG: hypothetical protein ACFE9D_06865 [Promethearchaeota archaeon]